MNQFSAGVAKLGAFRDRLQRWQEGLPFAPVTVEIQPSEQCNHFCPDCQGHFALSRPEAQRRARRGQFLDLAKLESFWEYPPAGVVLSGNTGDPLLYPHLQVLLSELRSRNLPTVLITNAEAMTPQLAEQVLLTCTGIRVSLDAHDADSFARSHGRAASWSRVLQGITLLIHARKRLNLHSRCRLGVGYLTNHENRAGMLPAASLARDMEVDYIQFRPYHFCSDDVSGSIAQCRELETPLFSVLASDQKYDFLHDQSRSYGSCHGAWFYTVIDPRGDVYICCHHVGREEARIGSLDNAKWVDILRSHRRRSVIDRYPNNSCIPLCRLHAHNQGLERIATYQMDFPGPPVDPQVADHAMFM